MYIGEGRNPLGRGRGATLLQTSEVFTIFRLRAEARAVVELAGVAKIAKTFDEQSKTGHAANPLGRRRGATLL